MPGKMKLVIGTRGSALALWQSRFVAEAIRTAHPTVNVELVTIKTSGDKILDTPLATIGSKGLFTKEIEEALIERSIDLAVHSMKDLPTELPDGLHVAAIPEREDPRDVFVSRDGRQLEELDPGSKIGTSSLRRKAFLLARLPAADVVPIRGNVDTRLKKIEAEGLAGAILAAAGIARMGFGDRITRYLEPNWMIPAVGQGALAIEARQEDGYANELVAALNHSGTAWCVEVERAFLRRMGGGCQVPMAAHCTLNGTSATVVAAVVHPDGAPIIRESWTGPAGDVSEGNRIADRLIEQGADSILKSVLGSDWRPGKCN
jgi:hydroxymethylbilane synthase